MLQEESGHTGSAAIVSDHFCPVGLHTYPCFTEPEPQDRQLTFGRPLGFQSEGFSVMVKYVCHVFILLIFLL